MADVPDTVETAVADLPVDAATCLEAGAGAGNMSRALAAAGADLVYAVTNDPAHAANASERTDGDRVAVLTADLRATPLPDDAVDVVTAHGLFNVVTPAVAVEVLAELSRVARPGAHLVVDDYDPLPGDAGGVAELFAVENAASELARGEPALTFYPEAAVRRLCGGFGWRHVRTETLLEPVPWTPDHLDAHADLAREDARTVGGDLGDALVERVTGVRERAPEGGVDAGRMYSVAFRKE